MPSTNGRLASALGPDGGREPTKTAFDHIVIESGRRIYTMICVVVTGILVSANDKFRQKFIR